MTKREIAVLSLLSGILLILSGFLIKNRLDLKKVDRIVRKKEAFKVFVKASDLVLKIWAQGDVKNLISRGKLTCEKEFGKNKSIDPTFYKCNPHFLNCYLREKKIELVGAKILPFSSINYVKVLSRSLTPGIKAPNYGVFIKLSVGEFDFPLVLEDSCSETLLPQRIYAYGPYKKGSADIKWDNFNRLILVDKHLVTKRDFYEWKNLENKKIKPQSLEEDLSGPITDLLPGEMKSFCAFRGKQVINSLAFDASTFFPGDLGKPRPLKIFRSPYPWSRQRRDSFLYNAKRYADFDFKKKYCLKAYTKECMGQFKYSDFQYKANSWLGLSNVLGGKMQYMENPIEPSKNLFASSNYFPATSKFHSLGLRESWDGEGLEPLNFDLSKRPLNEPGRYEIGFRCMRYLPNAL